jgi:methionyl aminopeptidase
VARTSERRAITRKSTLEIQAMREAGRVVARTLSLAREAARPGVSTGELDALAEAAIRDAGAVPSFKGYHGFPATLCTSINEEVVHGIPDPGRILAPGDLLSIDCGAILDGWHGDAAISVIVGEGEGERERSALARRLSRATEEALAAGIGAIRPGGHLTDIGLAVETSARARGFQVVREYGGHGIGRSMHEEPAVPNHGPAGHGPLLVAGMTIAIEPMLTAGTWRTVLQADEWTVKTGDGKLAAHWEHTVAITEDGVQILTLP